MDQGVPSLLAVDEVHGLESYVKRWFDHISSSVSCSGIWLIHFPGFSDGVLDRLRMLHPSRKTPCDTHAHIFRLASGAPEIM